MKEKNIQKKTEKKGNKKKLIALMALAFVLVAGGITAAVWTTTANAASAKFGDWVITTPATCDKSGEETRNNGKGAVETQEIPALGGDHIWIETEHVNATCTEGGYVNYVCERCGETKTEILPTLEHDWDEGVVTTPATCTEEGVMTFTCQVCGAKKTAVIDALGHDYAAVVTDPTCTEDGYTTHTCSVCGDFYTDTPVPALGHDFETLIDHKDATCTEDGYDIYQCLRCDETETIILPAFGHDYKLVAHKDAKCLTNGYNVYQCKYCHDTYCETILALGHDWDEGTATTPATCTEEGLMTYTCLRCGETKTEIIPALGHDYDAVVTAPTCLEGGYTTYTCSRCGDTYIDDYTTALGHDFSVLVETVAPTCTEPGYEVYKCIRCNETEKSNYVDALGHDWGVWTPMKDVNGNFVLEGDMIKGTCVCSRCGDKDYINVDIADYLNNIADSFPLLLGPSSWADNWAKGNDANPVTQSTQTILVNMNDYLFDGVEVVWSVDTRTENGKKNVTVVVKDPVTGNITLNAPGDNSTTYSATVTATLTLGNTSIDVVYGFTISGATSVCTVTVKEKVIS